MSASIAPHFLLSIAREADVFSLCPKEKGYKRLPHPTPSSLRDTSPISLHSQGQKQLLPFVVFCR